MLSKEQKLLLVKEILQRKDTIFGSFSEKSDAIKKKRAAWEEIQKILASNGYSDSVENLRDVCWRNIRQASVTKFDNSRKTGASGGSKQIVSDVDNIVLDIIGRESAVISGLAVAESNIGAYGDVDVMEIAANRELSGSALATSTCNTNATAPTCSSNIGDGNAIASEKLCYMNASINRKRKLTKSLAEEKEELLVKHLKLKNRKLRYEIKILKRDFGRNVRDTSSDSSS